jgi:hypothetical protein
MSTPPIDDIIVGVESALNLVPYGERTSIRSEGLLLGHFAEKKSQKSPKIAKITFIAKKHDNHNKSRKSQKSKKNHENLKKLGKSQIFSFGLGASAQTFL